MNQVIDLTKTILDRIYKNFELHRYYRDAKMITPI